MYDVPCFIETEQVQTFIENFAKYKIEEQRFDEENVAITFYKPFESVNLYLDANYDQRELGASGIWKSWMHEGILIGNGETAGLGGAVVSDPWVAMINDHGEIPEEEESRPTIRGMWTQEHEDSFQSVASSTQEKIQIRDIKTGKDIILNRAEVIAKFREDRYNNKLGFKVLNQEE